MVNSASSLTDVSGGVGVAWRRSLTCSPSALSSASATRFSLGDPAAPSTGRDDSTPRNLPKKSEAASPSCGTGRIWASSELPVALTDSGKTSGSGWGRGGWASSSPSSSAERRTRSTGFLLSVDVAFSVAFRPTRSFSISAMSATVSTSVEFWGNR